jgi:peptide/nickel transport system substrate-binding protein/oligopeptide transport system substrate-binding protein
LKFGDGNPITSTDVVYSIDRSLDKNLNSPSSLYYLGLIKDSATRFSGKTKSLIGDSLLAPDPQTVVIKISKKAAYFLDTLTLTNPFVIDKAMIQKYGNNFADHLAQMDGGDGPWKVSKYQRGKDIEFVPNPNYEGAKPKLSKVIFPFYSTNDTAYNAYQANQVDVTPVPAAHVAQAKSMTGQFVQYPVLSTSYIAMNYLTKPFDNVKIRQAFALAINKDEIASNIYKGEVLPTNHIVPQGMPGYYAGLKGPDGTTSTAGNPTMAKQLLQQGMKEEGITSLPPITYTTSSGGDATTRQAEAAIQQMWKSALGVNVTIADIDFNKLTSDTTAATNNAKGIQMWGIAWIADYPDAQDWTTLQFDNGSAQNNMNYGQNKSSDAAMQQQIQKTLEQADGNPNASSRTTQYQQAEQQLVNDVAWLPTNQQTVTDLRKSCVVGVQSNPQDLTPPDDWGSIYKTTATPCANVSQYQ